MVRQGIDSWESLCTEEVILDKGWWLAPMSRHFNVVVLSPPLYPRGEPKW